MGTVLYVATEHGVATVRQDGAGRWAETGRALGSWDVNEVVADPAAPGTLYAATRGDGVWVSTDGGARWRKPNRGIPGPGKVRCLTLDPHRPGTLWAGTEPIGVWVSEDAGAHWRELASVWDVASVASTDYPVPAVEPHVRDIALDPADPDTVYAALQVGHLIKSTDRGASWTLLSQDVDADAHTIVLHPEHPERVYLATGGFDARHGDAPGRALYRSADGGRTWQPMAMEFDNEYSVPLVMHPANPRVLLAAVGIGQPPDWRKHPQGAQTRVIRSIDGGDSWADVGMDAPEAVRGFVEAFAYDPADPASVYLSTRDGELYGSADGGSHWAPLGVNVGDISAMTAVHA